MIAIVGLGFLVRIVIVGQMKVSGLWGSKVASNR